MRSPQDSTPCPGKSDATKRIPSHCRDDVCLRENLPCGYDLWAESTTMQVPANFTQLLTEWRSGHPQALDRLTPLVYDELRRLARNYMRAERGSHTLQATAVVHEAFLRLIQANVALQDRGHFFALASRLMRRVLVDHAKSRSRIKRKVGPRDPVADDARETPPPMD